MLPQQKIKPLILAQKDTQYTYTITSSLKFWAIESLHESNLEGETVKVQGSILPS